DMEDGNITLLTDGGRNQNGNVKFNNSNSVISFTSTKRNGTDRDIYTMDPKNPSSAKLVLEVSGGGWSVLDWSPDDKQLLIAEGLSVNDSKLYILDLTTGLKALTGPVSKKELIANRSAKFSKDGKYYYFITDVNNDFSRLARWNLKTNECEFITKDIKWDVEGYDLSKEGSKLLFTVNEAGITKVYLMDPNDLSYRPVNSLP
ncbi:MAG TPA: S9 family peptidase, partial [Bacteroidia bacterium]|nr:S9 family peptidase [Bacteroidia bacterium]